MWQNAFNAALLLATASAAPAAIDKRDVRPTKAAVGPPGASGSPRGGLSLAGFNPAYPSPTESTDIPENKK
jgi:hypothetical protein